MAPQQSENEDQFDLVVIGAGAAGLTAAAKAVTTGARVLLLEKTGALGGSARYASYVWTAPDRDTMGRVNALGRTALGNAVVDDYPRVIDWVRSLGVFVGDVVPVLGFGRGRRVDMTDYLQRCSELVAQSANASIITSVTVDRLRVEDAAVVGVLANDVAGRTYSVRARNTLLASGGFADSPRLRGELIHPQAADIQVRASPGCTGEGLRLAIEAGAAFSRPGAGFYGHLIPRGIAYDDPAIFTEMSFYHSEHGVLVNLDGKRFVEEIEGDHLNTMSLTEQPEARALLIYDERVHRQVEMRPYAEGMESLDKFAIAVRRGAVTGVAGSIDELELLEKDWGYDAEQVHRSVLAFNEQHPHRALTNPPLYVIEVVPAITFTFGGIVIDAEARVLDERDHPVPGLLAAGADAGGVYDSAYAGGLAAALTFALRAAATATGEPSPGH